MQLYESRLRYFNDKARINYRIKHPSQPFLGGKALGRGCILQFTNMAAPRGLVKTVIPVSLKPKRIQTLEYAFRI